MAASTALDMLSLMQGMIADSALTKSAKQVPNVVTQVSAATCAYISGGDWDSFGKCMAGIWGAGITLAVVKQPGNIIRIMRVAASFIRAHPWGLAIAVA